MTEHATSFDTSSTPAQLKTALAEPALATAEAYCDDNVGWGATVDPGDGSELLEVIGFDSRDALRTFLTQAGITEIVDESSDAPEDEEEDELGDPDLA